MPVTNSASGVPVGATIYVPGTTAPPGFIKKNGALLSRSTYAALWAYAQASGNMAATDGVWQVGQFSPGDGATTFRIPDGRGGFVRGLDDGRGVDISRGIGTEQEDAMQGHRHASLTGNFVDQNGVGGNIQTGPTGGSISSTTGDAVTDGVNGIPRTATETRPRNVAELACIKY